MTQTRDGETTRLLLLVFFFLLVMIIHCFITVLVVLAGWTVIENRVAQYFAAFLFLSGIMNGVFAALDGVLFYVFFEATLIPMFIIVGVWGGPNRVYAALKFFLYTLLGSLLMLVALLYLYSKSGGSFSILDWHKLPIALPAQKLLFFAFLFLFCRKNSPADCAPMARLSRDDAKTFSAPALAFS